MRRIPWLAVVVLAGLLVVTLPLASARVAPQQLSTNSYLPLVYQVPLTLDMLVLYPDELTTFPLPYAIVSRGDISNDEAAKGYVDVIGARAQFALQGRERAYHLSGQSRTNHPYAYTNYVIHYARAAGAAQGLDMDFDTPMIDFTTLCGPWSSYPLTQQYGGLARAKVRTCTSLLGQKEWAVYAAVQHGEYVTGIGLGDTAPIDETMLAQFLTLAVAKLPK
jgi:hypothetical protein